MNRAASFCSFIADRQRQTSKVVLDARFTFTHQYDRVQLLSPQPSMPV